MAQDYMLALVHIERADAESAVHILQETAYKNPEQALVREALELARSRLGPMRHCLGALETRYGGTGCAQTRRCFAWERTNSLP